MSLEKQLADTDSIYCTKTTSSRQTSIFISNIGEPELEVLFGHNYQHNATVRLRLNKRNLAFVAVSHVIEKRTWFKRSSTENWRLDSSWLAARLKTLDDVFDEENAVFLAQLNKDDRSTNRLYLKGTTSLSREDGQVNIDLRSFLFSGDVIVLEKLDNGNVSFEVKIVDNPLINSVSHQSVAQNHSVYHPDLLAAIRTKPFILLAGISGTGKSRLVRQLARGCCPCHKNGSETEAHPLYDERRPGNYEMIQVRPNWHDSTDLMGYVTRITEDKQPLYVLTDFVRFLAKAWLYPDVPFFLCLDEMNLAPVEQYFAEYLSVIETRGKNGDGTIGTDVLVKFPPETLKHAIDELLAPYEPTTPGFAKEEVDSLRKTWTADGGLRIPPNFVVMGTVNMDETTYSFSRKVLDRAMSFELNDVDMDSGLVGDSGCACGSIDPLAAKCGFTEGFEVYAAAKDDCDKIKAFLVAINKVLDKTPFKIAYRTRNEIMIYCHERAKDGVPLGQALDEATSMKILSRVEGDKRRLVVRDEDLPEYNGKGLLESMLDAVLKGLKSVRGGEEDYTESGVCSGKLKEMISQLESGYTSFWTR